MKFKDYRELNEVFDNPYKWKETDSKDGMVKFKFKTEQGDVVYVIFEYHTGEVEIDFKRDGRYDVTGAGDSFRIFATVKDIFLSEIPNIEDEVDVVLFSSLIKEASRVKFYNRMVKWMKKKLKWKRLNIHNDGVFVHYEILKK